MSKGFGAKRNQEMGFTLVVIPDANAYAARSDFDDGTGEPFFGVTNMLEDAQIWKTKKEAQKAAGDYIPWLLEDYLDDDDVTEFRLEIRSVSQNKKGKLHTRVIEEMLLQVVPEDLEIEERE